MEEDRLIPLSYISQYDYCKRRVGLLMLEQQWSDSTDTVKGTAEHKNVHTAGHTKRNELCIITELQVFSKKLGLIGKCDAVEAVEDENGIAVELVGDKLYRLYPVEYKHGKLRSEEEYELQLCAQAMCLEEMYSCRIDSGAIFYISSHRRKEVHFGDKLRNRVAEISEKLLEMLELSQVPKADVTAKCIRCSMRDICMPETQGSVSDYMKQVRNELHKGE